MNTLQSLKNYLVKAMIVKNNRANQGQLKTFQISSKSKATVNKFISNLFRNSYIIPQKFQSQLQDEYNCVQHEIIKHIQIHVLFKISIIFNRQSLIYQDISTRKLITYIFGFIRLIINMISLWLNIQQIDNFIWRNNQTRSQIIKYYLLRYNQFYNLDYSIKQTKGEFKLEILQIVQIIVTTKKVIINFDKFFESLYSKGEFSNLIDLFSLVITIFFFAHITA
ncbi:unnamed protein product [Paramecium sonneborni]|uniref:Transmembrane protein n=1 Tax=Paramecium sonneborni TaxID=65129 RepID=A0A8S1NE08_9CILI|nr:unnamed protein product [Paramecium sonneborni]